MYGKQHAVHTTRAGLALSHPSYLTQALSEHLRYLPALSQRDRVIEDTVEHYTNLATMLRQEQQETGGAWREVEAYRAKQVASGEYDWVNFREQKYLMRLQHEAEAVAKLVQ